MERKEKKEKIDDILITGKYWDCECDDNFVHPNTYSMCDICGVLVEEQPCSRVLKY